MLDEARYERLVRYCRWLSRNADLAQDLANDALLEGWRNAHKLTDSDGLDRWLAAIARNVYLRWRRQRGRDALVGRLSNHDDIAAGEDPWRASDDREIGAELADALAHLPALTRTAFLLRHLNDASHADIAARTRLSEAAVSMRLSRARTQLRRTLDPGRIPDEPGCTSGIPKLAWRDTRIWCSRCGTRQRQIRCDDVSGVVSFRCPDCDDDPRIIATKMPLANAHIARMIGGLRQPAAINRRIEAWVNDYFRRALAGPAIECTHCGAPAIVIRTMPSVSPAVPRDQLGVHVRCERCGTICSSSLASLVMALPEVSAFTRANGRVRTLPLREIESTGRPAVRMTIESVGSLARLDVLSARDTFELIGIYPASQLPAG